ncbi:MAG TPA: CocE/NonD family hydrolase [Thermoleophilaceae bacterium]
MRSALAIGAVLAALLAAAPAQAAPVSQDARFTASDGVSLATTVSGEGSLSARPTLVEFSPYGRGSGTLDPGPDYNTLLVQIRGTGDSDGSFDALGPRTQDDVAEVLRWACDQPWSDGRLALNGFSASAITIYNSLHNELPCVKAAVLKSGTFELYRDLIWPGGISNLVPAAGVMGLIGAPALEQGGDRLSRNPASGADIARGLAEAGLNGMQHSTLDSWWRERGFRGDVNHLPTLMIDGFYDVESRGAFQGFQQLRGDGAHLVVVGGHDGAPAGTDAGLGEARAWLDRYVRGIDNGVDTHRKVQLWLPDGDREDFLKGDFVRFDADDWPVPGTRWSSLALDPARAGGGRSLNDGSLTLGTPAGTAQQSFTSLPSPPSASDQPNTALVGASGANAITGPLPILTDMTIAEPLGLSYTTKPFASDVLTAGPASLELRVSTTAPETGLWAVVSDVDSKGTAHSVATGRLSTAYPGVDDARSLHDPDTGAIVQPYGDYSHKTPATPGQERLYRIELWPIGNRFKAGDRLRVHVLGASAASAPQTPSVDTVRVGAGSGSRLLLPVLPGSDLHAALR